MTAVRLFALAVFLTSAGARASDAPELAVEVHGTPRERETATVIGAAEGRRMAGTQDDAVKALQALPGLARAGAGDGGIIAWGSTPAETGIYVDGVELPLVYHGSGVRSVIPARWLTTVELSPGAYPAEYGRGTGGVLALTTRPLDFEQRRYELHLDTLDGGAFVATPVTSRIAVGVGYRHSLVDRWADALVKRDGGLVTLPEYSDAQVKISAALGAREELSTVYLFSRDAWSRTAPWQTGAGSNREAGELGFQRLYASYRRTSAELVTEFVPFMGVDHDERTAVSGASGWLLEQRHVRYGLRAQQRRRLGRALALTYGMDVLGTFSRIERRGSLTLPPREGDPYAFGQPIASDASFDAYRTHVVNTAPYIELGLNVGRWRITPGARLETSLIEVSRQLPSAAGTPPIGASNARAVLEPRLAVHYAASDAVTFFAAGGVYHAPPAPADLGAIFGNPALGSARALQGSIGERAELAAGPFVEATLFGKTQTDIAVRSPEPSPHVARALIQSGEARAFGAQLLVRQTLRGGFSGWLAWTISRAERRAESSSPYRLFDFDQPHVVSLTLTQRLGRFTLGARARHATGSPRTPVVASSYNLRAERYEPVFGAVDSERLPSFFELDLRVDREFLLGNAVKLSLYADWLNATFRRNAEELAYSADYAQHSYFTGLPSLVVFGARLER